MGVGCLLLRRSQLARFSPSRCDQAEDPPREVQVTLLPNPDADPLLARAHLPRLLRVGITIVIALAAAGVAGFLAAGLPGDRSAPTAAVPAESARPPVAAAGHLVAAARRPGAPGVAAAYGYPLACLSITIDEADPTYARADFNHASPCGRYDGYVTAIFHWVDDAWRPVLDATGYSCPTPSLSTAVQTALDVCT